MSLRTVVFDMDGTLVQTRAASWEVFQETASHFELPVRSAEDFFALFQDNFFESLARVCPDQATADAVREHFMIGLKERYQPDFVPGMVDVIKALAPHFALAVMSSNSMDAIRRILQTAGVAQCFAHVFSAEVGTSKRRHLERVRDDPGYGGVRQCSPAYLEAASGERGHSSNGWLVNRQGSADFTKFGIDTSHEPAGGDGDVVLITDTVGDIAEAKASGTRAIGVAWGMHSSAALLQSGAERVVYWPQEIVALLLPNGSTPAATCACASGGSCPVATRPAAVARSNPAPGPAGIAAELGRQRHHRRSNAVAQHWTESTATRPGDRATSPCRCGRGCGISDAMHCCGPPTTARAPEHQLVAAIARIATRPP